MIDRIGCGVSGQCGIMQQLFCVAIVQQNGRDCNMKKVGQQRISGIERIGALDSGGEGGAIMPIYLIQAGPVDEDPGGEVVRRTNWGSTACIK